MPNIEALLQHVDSLTPDDLEGLSAEELQSLVGAVSEYRSSLQKDDQLTFYKPANPRAREIHYSTAKQTMIHGGNRSGKSDHTLADAIICMTKIVPVSLPNYPVEKIQCPMRVRLTCQSFNTWETVIKPKLQWDQWSGKSPVGGQRGHWGWIPRRFLKKGKWDESWSAQYRILTLTCGCTFQVMAYTQEVGEFAGTSIHLAIHDEGPPWNIYRENRMRTLDTSGRSVICFTPPDDEADSWDAAWIYDELYEKGRKGHGKDPNIDVIELWTEENRINDAADIEEVTKGLTPIQKTVRTKGAFMHLSGRIYSQYTDRPQWWCFHCNNITITARNDLENSDQCAQCGTTNIVEFCHFVEPQDRYYKYPCVSILDPHPRKANMMMWISVDPYDDYAVIAELQADDEPVDMAVKVRQLENDLGLNVAARLIDPNMAESPAHSAGHRGITVRREYDKVGLRCALADDSFNVGMKRIKELLRPDPRTRRPRITVFNTCHVTNRQILRYVWQEHGINSRQSKDPKAVPRDKDDDYPTMLKYFVNGNYTFAGLNQGGMPLQTTKIKRAAAYG